MKTKVLAPIKVRPGLYDDLDLQIAGILRREIYLPLIRELGARPDQLRNSYDDLIDAIMSGRIYYIDGRFQGQFDAATSREIRTRGGEWDRKNQWWDFPRSLLTMDMKSVIGASQSKFDEMARKLDRRLELIVPTEMVDKLKISKILDTTIWKVNKDFEANVRQVAIAPKLSPQARARISSEYSSNLVLSIRDFAAAEIKTLRTGIQSHLTAGGRYESIIKTIQDSYGVTQNKAKFLARQETNLLVSKFKETRYQEVGLHEYIWRCVHNPKDKSPDQHTLGNVRYYHGLLDGTTQSWQHPPQVSKNRHAHPGCDYNCRCTACPIVRF